MLEMIRKHAQGWIAWVIVGLIIITFALFGIDQYARGDKTVTVAEVNGEDITANAFLTLYNRQKVRLQEQFGDMYADVVKDDELRKQVLDALIESEVIRQWANDNHMFISDQQLAGTIQSAEVFQQNGKFSEKIYEEVLLRNGLNVARFEYEQRQYLIEAQYRELTSSSSFATASEVDQLAALQGQQRNVAYLRVDQRPYLESLKVSDDEVAKNYEANKASYIEPEKVSIEYVDLSQAVIAKDIPVTDEILKKYFTDNASAFSLPEKRHAKHILIAIAAQTDEAEAAAQTTVAEVQAKLKAGESFEALAKTYSKDTGSAESGGDLGSFEQGMMVPAFDEAVFTMKEGEVSEPVKTDFGYHLIKLVAIEARQPQDFATVKEKVQAQYQLQEAEHKYFELLEKLSTVAYEQADTLEPAAEAVGQKVQTSELFSREGGADTVLSNGKVINAAFSDDVLKSGLNSTAIELEPNHSVVIRVKTHEPAKQKSLEAVAPVIKEQLVRQAAINKAAELGVTLLAKVNAGENPESLVTEGVEWNNVGWVARNAQNLLPQLTAHVFKAVKPEEGKSLWSSLKLSTGDTVLVRLSGVKTETIPAEQKEPLKTAFAELMGEGELEGRLRALIDQAKIVKKEDYQTIK